MWCRLGIIWLPLLAIASWEQGGNAIDAGVASGIAINLVMPENTNFGGVAPIMIYHAATDEVVTISRLGRWPRAASIEYFEHHHGGEIPLGITRSAIPAAPDTWLTALEKYGTMSFEQVVTPALELAEKGHPLSQPVRDEIAQQATPAEGGMPFRFASTRDLFIPDGRVPEVGKRFVQRDLARTFKRLIEAERAQSRQRIRISNAILALPRQSATSSPRRFLPNRPLRKIAQEYQPKTFPPTGSPSLNGHCGMITRRRKSSPIGKAADTRLTMVTNRVENPNTFGPHSHVVGPRSKECCNRGGMQLFRVRDRRQLVPA